MARRRALSIAVRDLGASLLAPKLQILSRTGNRRPGVALSILTGGLADAASPMPPTKSQLVARTVYLTKDHLRDLDALIEIFGTCQVKPRRVTRSAVLRRAIEHLRDAVEADPAKSLPLWENA